MQTEVISTSNLSATYNGVEVIRGITLSVYEGDYVGLVGPNGSGKSTLIKALLGLLPPSNGTVNLYGISSSSFNQWGRIGYLPQRMNMLNKYFPCTVREVISMGIASMHNNHEKEQKIDYAMKMLDIEHIGNKLIGRLSGGQQQRVLISRALVNEPELLILDEPTAAIDPETRDNFYSLLRDLNRDKKVTIILVTHDTGSIGEHANKLLYLDKEVIFYGSFEEFCRSEYMESFFGAASQHIICHKH